MPYALKRREGVDERGVNVSRSRGQRARWVAVWMPIEGEERGIAILDHEQNPEHPHSAGGWSTGYRRVDVLSVSGIWQRCIVDQQLPNRCFF